MVEPSRHPHMGMNASRDGLDYVSSAVLLAATLLGSLNSAYIPPAPSAAIASRLRITNGRQEPNGGNGLRIEPPVD